MRIVTAATAIIVAASVTAPFVSGTITYARQSSNTAEAPVGWKAERTAGGAQTYRPGDLNPGEVFSVTVYPAETLGGKSLEEWLLSTLARDPDPPGEATGPAKIQGNASAKIAAAVRIFRSSEGIGLGAVYNALSADGQNVRLTRTVFSGQKGLFDRYKQGAFAITGSVIDDLKRGSAASNSTAPASTGTVRTPPRPAAAKEKAKPAPSTRYPYVVAPGKGIKSAQIAAVVHHYHVEVYSAGVNGIGTNVTDDAFLLLKDGTAYRGLPVPPDQMDVLRSRRMEPAKWGWWRKKGKEYLVAWGDNPGKYHPLPGDVVLPGKSGTRLQGRWGTGSSSADITGSSYRLWGITFTQAGRFQKDQRGGASNSTFMQQGGQAAINTSYDDNGSVTSATTPNTTVAAGHKNNPNGDREGTYSIDGYVLTLRYDNGLIQRTPFFFGDATQDTLWFEGHQLARDRDKK